MQKMMIGENFLPYNRDLVERAKEMRKNPTPAERRLWNLLKDHKPQFLRQRPIDNFIVDFYCPHLKLVIEVDGDQHYTDEGKAHDLERTDVLKAYGIEVIRFSNKEIMDNFSCVQKIMFDILYKNTSPFSKGGSPTISRGGGIN